MVLSFGGIPATGRIADWFDMVMLKKEESYDVIFEGRYLYQD
jgi:hypothetical protein